MSGRKPRLFLLLVILGISMRSAFVMAAGGEQLTFHSGGSDAPAYVLLAKNLVGHKGFTYAGQPSAFRPPAYPLVLAGFMTAFGGHYLLAIRWLQFLLGLLTVGACSAGASRLFNKQAARATFIIGLFLATLVFSTAQVLTECASAFLTALFLLFLVRQYEDTDFRSASGLGLTAGVESLLRFNAAALPLFAAWAVFQTRHKRAPLPRGAIVLLLPILVVFPWLVRNELVFHDHALFSTHTGVILVEGAVTPQGRTQPGDTRKLIDAMGWAISQLETNNASRLSLPSEPDLNERALRAAPRLWVSLGWKGIPLLGKKVADFWLSTDQLVDTKSFPFGERLIRAGAVMAYWAVLAFAIGGWFHVRESRPGLASILLVYAIGLTVLHLPLVMNTRLRIPLLDPLIIIFSGAGWVQFVARVRNRGLRTSVPARSASQPAGSDADS